MKQWTAFTLALALAGTAGAGLATSGEDDLAIVKKAVASPAPARSRVVRTTTVATAQAAPVRRARSRRRSGAAGPDGA
jgi:hypothetical protein